MKNLEDFSKQEKIRQIYDWAGQLSAEVKTEDELVKEYYWTNEAKRVLSRVLSMEKGLIGVIGLQGVGKTSLFTVLRYKLSFENLINFSTRNIETLNFRKIVDDVIEQKIEKLFFIEKLKRIIHYIRAFAFPKEVPSNIQKIQNVFGVDPKTAELLYEAPDKFSSWDTLYGRYLLWKKKNKVTEDLDWWEKEGKWIKFFEPFKKEDNPALLDEFNSIRYDFENFRESNINKLVNEPETYKEVFKTKTVILIDLPDYPKNKPSYLRKDLEKIKDFWYKNARNTLLVVFIQKELFHSDFFFGKMDVIELKPLKPNELVYIYKEKFGSTFPFVEEALKEVAVLSRGVFRRFQKYIQICLDVLFERKLEEITVEDVKKTISLDLVAKDLELELLQVFPRNPEKHLQAANVLTYLTKNGPVCQKELVKKIFDGKDYEASRILDRLEAFSYIRRRWNNGNKVVEIVF